MATPTLKGFASVRGHADAIALLRRAIAQGRVASAYLFTGPPGVGKDRVAHALAQHVNCTQRVDDNACGVCDACRRLLTQTHPDVLLLQRALKDAPKDPTFRRPDRIEDIPESELSQIVSVQQVRELIARMPFRPHEGGTRWVIVREAERLRQEAANAFLKTLEEPPAATHFVLLTHRPSMLLPTIRSRCQTLRFGLLDDADVRAVLADLGHPADLIDTVAPLGDGSVGRALEFVDPSALKLRTDLCDALRAAVAAYALDDTQLAGLLDLAEAVGNRLKADAHNGIDRRDLDAALTLLYRHYRNEAVAAAGRDSRAALTSAARATVVRETLEALDGGGNLSPRHCLQSMLLRLREARA